MTSRVKHSKVFLSHVLAEPASFLKEEQADLVRSQSPG